MAHFDLEVAIGIVDVDRPSGKGVGDRHSELILRANLLDGGDGRSQVCAVAGQYRRTRADLATARRRIAVGPEVIVETPAPHILPQYEQLGSVARIAAMREHA